MGQDQAWASGRGLDDAVRLRREFARRFAEGIRKLARNTPGDCRKKIVRLVARMPEAIGLAGLVRFLSLACEKESEKCKSLVFTQRR
ncbi:hypothetical protein B296_00009465 [Ensete ventricosum]|uniref:Uncharacterized protein n=1 Tax=Ensete ventricosum TaxID=4639 RepID=A0A426XDA1_ENSVE|nr:hypothetical protein B296_00009465 [Ensete ventricosum]